jgi:ribonuclease HII
MARKSTVQQLSPEVRSYLERRIVEGRLTLDELIADLQETFPNEAAPSRSAVHRYGKKLERKLSAIKASTEAARLIAEGAPDQADLRSAAVISLVQSELFEAMVSLQEAEDEDDAGTRVKLLSQAARAIAEVSRASVVQKRWQDEVAEKLAKIEESMQDDARYDAYTFNRIKEELYGS